MSHVEDLQAIVEEVLQESSRVSRNDAHTSDVNHALLSIRDVVNIILKTDKHMSRLGGVEAESSEVLCGPWGPDGRRVSGTARTTGRAPCGDDASPRSERTSPNVS